jgi:hypothetical protein
VRVLIRAARPGDGEGLAQAALDLAEQYVSLDPERFKYPEADLVALNEAELRESLPEDELWLVAEVDGKAVGEVQAVIHEPAKGAEVQAQRDVGLKRVYVNYLAVQAKYRNRGIGSRLLDAVERWARDEGAELVLTDTNLRSPEAVHFYEKQGYTRQSVILRKRLG